MLIFQSAAPLAVSPNPEQPGHPGTATHPGSWSSLAEGLQSIFHQPFIGIFNSITHLKPAKHCPASHLYSALKSSEEGEA